MPQDGVTTEGWTRGKLGANTARHGLLPWAAAIRTKPTEEHDPQQSAPAGTNGLQGHERGGSGQHLQKRNTMCRGFFEQENTSYRLCSISSSLRR